jgi:hypothetical protein
MHFQSSRNRTLPSTTVTYQHPPKHIIVADKVQTGTGPVVWLSAATCEEDLSTQDLQLVRRMEMRVSGPTVRLATQEASGECSDGFQIYFAGMCTSRVVSSQSANSTGTHRVSDFTR